MKCHDLSYWIYQKVLIETSWPFILNISKGVYWKVITLQIGYIFKVPIEQKWPYWMKICLLNENVHFDKKCVFCLKMRILNENVSIDRKDTYWMKTCILIENVHIEWKSVHWGVIILLGINSGSYSCGNFFSFIFFRSTRNFWVFSKIAICRTQNTWLYHGDKFVVTL